VDLPRLLAEALRQHRARQVTERLASPVWLDNGWELVFTGPHGEPLNPRAVLTDLKRILRAAGLPAIRFHDLRHSAASLLLLHGVPVRMVADILGHSSTALTQNTYQHVLPQLREQAVKAQEAILGG
jgi:integrase